MKISGQFLLLFDQGVNNKVNKHCDIRRQYQNLTPCPNDMIHTLISLPLECLGLMLTYCDLLGKNNFEMIAWSAVCKSRVHKQSKILSTWAQVR